MIQSFTVSNEELPRALCRQDGSSIPGCLIFSLPATGWGHLCGWCHCGRLPSQDSGGQDKHLVLLWLNRIKCDSFSSFSRKLNLINNIVACSREQAGHVQEFPTPRLVSTASPPPGPELKLHAVDAPMAMREGLPNSGPWPVSYLSQVYPAPSWLSGVTSAFPLCPHYFHKVSTASQSLVHTSLPQSVCSFVLGTGRCDWPSRPFQGP